MAEDYGIKITKAGKGITSIIPADYHFWSKYRSKSIVYQGQLAVTTPNGNLNSGLTSNSYTHGFGYLPQHFIFVNPTYSGSNYVNVNHSDGGSYGKDGEQWDEWLRAYVTTTTVVVQARLGHYVPGSGQEYSIQRTYTFDILLFMEEVETS